MKTLLDIGIQLPLDMVTSTTAILAKKGAGKSYAGSVLAEDMIAAGQRVAVIDPTDAWWGLRAKADDSHNGLPVVIFGGDHADLPLEEGMGAVVADLLVDGLVASCILCTKGFESDASRIRFLTQFGQRLFFRNRDPLHVFMDECDDYLPQRLSPEQTKLLHVWSRIVKQGRKQGLGVTMISQRAAVVHKDVLSQIDTLLTLRTTAPHDIKAIGEWIRAKKGDDGRAAMAMLDSLPSLPIGSAYVYSPGFLEIDPPRLFKVRTRRTFDSGATPKVGEKRIEPKVLAPVDLDALRESLKTTIDKAKAEDPKALAARIRELERELARKGVAPAAPPPPPERIEVPILTAEDRVAIEQIRVALGDASARIEEMTRAIKAKTTLLVAPPRPVARPMPYVPIEPRAPQILPPRPSSKPSPNGLRSGAAEMLRALASLGGTLTRKQLATLAGIKPTGSTFSTYLSDLRGMGYVETSGDEVRITNTGQRDAGAGAAVDLREVWRSKLRSGACAMLDALLASYPNPIARATLAEMAGIDPEGSTFSTYTSDLVSNGLAHRRGRDLVASEVFFMGDKS